MTDQPQYSDRERDLMARAAELARLEQRFRSAYPDYEELASETIIEAGKAAYAKDPTALGGNDEVSRTMNEREFLGAVARELEDKHGSIASTVQRARDAGFKDPRGNTVRLW